MASMNDGLPSNASTQRREESGHRDTSSVITHNNEASRRILQELNTLIPRVEQQVDDAYAHMIRFHMFLPACPFRDKVWFARPRAFFLPSEQDVPEEDAMAPKRISTSRGTSTPRSGSKTCPSTSATTAPRESGQGGKGTSHERTAHVSSSVSGENKEEEKAV